MLLDVYQSQNHAKLFTFFTIFPYEAFCIAASEWAIFVVCDTDGFVLTRWRRARWLSRNKVGKWFMYFETLGYMNPPIRSATPRATLTHLSCSPNFPRASYLDERTLTYETIVLLYFQPDRKSFPRGICLLTSWACTIGIWSTIAQLNLIRQIY